MAHEFESGFFVREPAWHDLGKVLPNDVNSEEAIRHAGLDWKVSQTNVFLEGAKTPINNVFANVRSSDGSVLGITTERYKVLQNSQAFTAMDSLLKKGVRYESAGSLRGGKVIWLLAKIGSEQKILDDIVEPYALLMNSHDGSHGVKVCLTPVRVVCMNTLVMALNKAPSVFKMKHTGDLQAKVLEAQRILGLNSRYLSTLNASAEKLAKVKVSPHVFDSWLEKIFPLADDATNRVSTNVLEKREALKLVYTSTPDIANHRNSAWGVFQAMTDWFEHSQPQRETESWQENRMIKIASGSDWVNESLKTLVSMAA